MSMQFWTDSAAFKRQFTKLFQRSIRAFVLIGTLAAASCAAPSQPFVGPDPANPSAGVPAVGYRSTLGSHRSQRPVEPGDWVDTNDRVTPRPKSGQ